MARINKTQFAILGCLSIRPMSAYDVKTFMARSTNYFWMEYEAQLYPTLKKLEKAGLVTSHEAVAEKGGVRNLYEVTDEGLHALREWLTKKTEQTNYRNEFLLKLFFSNHIDKKILLKHIDQYQAEAAEQLKQFEAIEDNVQNLKKMDRKLYILATIRYGIYMVNAEIEWCRETAKLLNSEKK